MTTQDRVDAVLRRQLGPGFEWDQTTSLADDRPDGLSLDSLDMVELVVGIENEFSVDADDALGVEFTNVGDIVRWIDTTLSRPVMFG